MPVTGWQGGEYYRLKWPAPFGILGMVTAILYEDGFCRLAIRPFVKPGDDQRREEHLWAPDYLGKEIADKTNKLMYFEVNPNSLLNDNPIICNVQVLDVTSEQLGVVWKCGMF